MEFDRSQRISERTTVQRAIIAKKPENGQRSQRGHAMEVCIKVPPRYYERLWSRVPDDSCAREPIEKATRIDQSADGAFSEAYSIPCDENQARILLKAAAEYCPELVPEIERALARPGG
jgi:hypothetical protein